jgi:hypothetical protein
VRLYRTFIQNVHQSGDSHFFLAEGRATLEDMNTTKTALRTVLATAAAGALVLGSVGGATAAPDKAKGPKAMNPAASATVKLQNVSIKRHKKIDLANADAAQTALALRAKVRYSKKVSSEDALQSFGISLGVFDKKVNGTFVGGSDSAAAPVELKAKKRDRKVQFYAGEAVIADVWSAGQIEALTAAVAANGKAYICTYSVDTTFDAFSMQTRKRLGVKADGSDFTKKTVRDCVKVVDTTEAAE